MRQCPRCQVPHDDAAKVCPVDGLPLVTQTRQLTMPPAPAVGEADLAHGSGIVAPPDEPPNDDGETPAPASARVETVPADASARRPGQPPKRDDDRAEAAVGRVLGSYRLLQVIGRGGMGRVYLAEHVRLGRRVALKLLRPEYAVKRDAVARFFQEAKAVNKIRHPNIVDITDFIELDDGTTFIIMELLEGVSLGKLIRTRVDLSTARQLAIVIQVCDALFAAHSVGVIHRDLKPDNVFVGPDGAGGDIVKLLDFGVAKLISEEDEGGEFFLRTAAGSVVGTPAYMSPEQAGGLPVDGRSDVYSLGAIMYELFTQQALFTGRAFGEFVNKHLNVMPVPPSLTAGGADILPDIDRAILRCLEKRPESRFPSAHELREELVRILRSVDSGFFIARRPGGTILTPASGNTWRPPSEVKILPADPAEASSADAASGRMTPAPRAQSRAGEAVPAGGFDEAGPGLVARLDLPPAVSRRRLPLAIGGLICALALGGTIYLLVIGPTEPPRAPRATTPTVAPIVPVVAPAAPPRPLPVEIALASQPSGAAVYLLGSSIPLCTTPCNATIDPADGGSPTRRVLLFRRDGYAPREEEIRLDGERHQQLAPTLDRSPAGPRPAAHTLSPAPPAPPLRPELPRAEPPRPEPQRPPSGKIDPTETLNPFGNRP